MDYAVFVVCFVVTVSVPVISLLIVLRLSIEMLRRSFQVPDPDEYGDDLVGTTSTNTDRPRT